MHIVKYGKDYATMQEYDYRLSIFKETNSYIDEWNSQNHSHTLAHNEFSDNTDNEWARMKGHINFFELGL